MHKRTSAVNSKNQVEQRKAKRKELLQIKPPSFVSVATDKHDQKHVGKKRIHVLIFSRPSSRETKPRLQ